MASKAPDKRAHDVKVGIDLVLMAFLVTLPCVSSVSGASRAGMGAVFLALVVTHNLLNLRWWRALRRGGWRVARVAQVMFAVLGLVLAVVACVALLNSCLVCWMFLVMSIHIGQCVWPMTRAELSGHGHVRRETSPDERRAKGARLAVLSIVLGIMGVTSSVLLGLPSCLVAGAGAAPLATGVPIPLAVAGLVCVLLALASLGAWLQEGLSHIG